MKQATDISDVMQLDRLVHEPARLLILSVLARAKSVEFGFVLHLSGLSKGNLSSHMSKLEAAGLIKVNKQFRGKRPLTELAITPSGRHALTQYRQQLDALIHNLPTE